MRSIEFSLENPWLLLAALPALALILLFCRRMRRAPGAPRPERWALALRVAEAALAVLILAQVSLTSYTARRQTIVLADRSDSMAGSQEAVEDRLALMAELAGEEQPLQVMDFAASWGPLRQPQDPAALDGLATGPEAALIMAAGPFPNGGKRDRVAHRRCAHRRKRGGGLGAPGGHTGGCNPLGRMGGSAGSPAHQPGAARWRGGGAAVTLT